MGEVFKKINIAYPPNPIVLIGSKGAGKTTFINHLFKYKFKGDEFEHHYIVYIDFRKYYELGSQFDAEQLASGILESLYEKYDSLMLHSLPVLKRAYLKEIRRNNESIWEWDLANDSASYQNKLSSFLEQSKKDIFKHLSLLSLYLISERRKRLIVIIDNADQFNDLIQKDLFLFSHSLAKSALCGSVISLREGYYRKWQNSPPFDAYDSNVYHVTAPKYVEILQKRSEFAINKSEKKDNEMKLRLTNGKEIEITSGYVFPALQYQLQTIFQAPL